MPLIGLPLSFVSGPICSEQGTSTFTKAVYYITPVSISVCAECPSFAARPVFDPRSCVYASIFVFLNAESVILVGFVHLTRVDGPLIVLNCFSEVLSGIYIFMGPMVPSSSLILVMTSLNRVSVDGAFCFWSGSSTSKRTALVWLFSFVGVSKMFC